MTVSRLSFSLFAVALVSGFVSTSATACLFPEHDPQNGTPTLNGPLSSGVGLTGFQGGLQPAKPPCAKGKSSPGFVGDKPGRDVSPQSLVWQHSLSEPLAGGREVWAVLRLGKEHSPNPNSKPLRLWKNQPAQAQHLATNAMTQSLGQEPQQSTSAHLQTPFHPPWRKAVP